uniref:Dilute domain-containing protein n=1 Tax=Noccaea caerulescens TaxID=107243 RepID=A0A1J3DFM5_NOCCA
MKGRTTSNVQSNRSTKNGKRDQKPQKSNGAKRSSEQERLKALDTKEESNVSPLVNNITTQPELSEVDKTVDDSGNGSLDTHQEETDKEETVNDEEESKDFDAIANEKTDGSGSCSETCEGVNAVKTVEVCDDASNGGLSGGSDESEASDVKEKCEEEEEEEEALREKVENLEARIEKLEEELREVASLEISLYSVVPDHSSSAHKLHTPARRISRLYIHACKHWSQEKRATVARNTVSGLILVAKSCGNDVSRLTFWLSNIIALREIISQAIGKSHVPSHITQTCQSNGSEEFFSEKLSYNQSNGFKWMFEGWQETETLTTALERVEFWIFSRIVESVWWQVFTPHMQSPETSGKKNEKLNRAVSRNQEKGSFSISLWQNAFKVALSRLCPMRGSGHECGCLPILAKMVMEKCIARVDVAMFNAILRESEDQIPTDPVSDPILDSSVLPIPSGDLSFGSGAQLKNAIGNWCRCLAEMFDMNTRDSVQDNDLIESENEKSFSLLNELSDLLMLPKDMLMDLSIRDEVCPSISLSLITRILCNFTPDEFCPDRVPGAVLEELNRESILEDKLSGVSFPYGASPVSYIPPSSVNVAEKVVEDGGDMSRMSRNVSIIQRKGYTSDEELEELESPLTFVIDQVSVSPTSRLNGKVKQEAEEIGQVVTNARYELLREVWSV